MDAELVTLAATASKTLVTLMATEGWERARDGVVALWRRFRPEDADSVGGDLEAGREDLTATSGDAETGDELQTEWKGRLRRFLLSNPDAAVELRRLLQELEPALPGTEQSATRVHLEARATGHGRVYQAGRDQHITER